MVHPMGIQDLGSLVCDLCVLMRYLTHYIISLTKQQKGDVQMTQDQFKMPALGSFKVPSEACQVQHARYCKILMAIPTLEEHVRFMVETNVLGIGELASLVSACYLLQRHHLYPRKLEQAANKGHTKDLKILQKHARHYIPSIEAYQDTSPSLHFAIAQLLCPRHMQDIFDSDEEDFCRLVQCGLYDFDHHSWPLFFYPEEMAYSLDAREDGLLHGPFLISVSRLYIYTGMS